MDKELLELDEDEVDIKLSRMKRKLIIIAIPTVALLLVIAIIFFSGYKRAKAEYEAEIESLKTELAASMKVNIGVINEEIKEIGELATVEYLYTDAGKFSDPKQLFDYDIPFTTKSFIAKWDGIIKAGVDITRVTAELDESQKVITVQMPQAEVLSHEIENDSIETLSESDGLFNPISVEDVRTFDAVSKDKMEQRAIENGLLEKAVASAQTIITRVLNSDPTIAGNYNIVFEIV